VLRAIILAASRNARVEQLVTNAPVARSVVRRFVGGPDSASGVVTAATLLGSGLAVSLDHLGEDTTDRARADAAVADYLHLLAAMQRAGLTAAEIRAGPAPVDVSVKLTAIGLALPGDGRKIALDGARRISLAARSVRATVTLDMEDHTKTDATLETLAELRADFPDTGAVLQAYLRRTLGDCRDLAGRDSRVRLCKGAYREPASVAFVRRREVDLNYVRCLNVLLGGDGYPMIATHDPRLIAIAARRAADLGRAKETFEFQMLHGVRPGEQRRLAGEGSTVRVYIPYGAQWYSYLMRRLAERPANLVFFARALSRKG
jgi:proline dehydrogenase